MTKKTLNQMGKYTQEFLNTLDQGFIFDEEPINRFKVIFSDNNKIKQEKSLQLSDLEKYINSIQNCNLKDNSKNFVMGDGDINSPIMLIGETPGEKEKQHKSLQVNK